MYHPTCACDRLLGYLKNNREHLTIDMCRAVYILLPGLPEVLFAALAIFVDCSRVGTIGVV